MAVGHIPASRMTPSTMPMVRQGNISVSSFDQQNQSIAEQKNGFMRLLSSALLPLIELIVDQ